MKLAALLLLLVVAACAGQEGDVVNVAGVDFEPMAWRVECGQTARAELEERYSREIAETEREDVCVLGDPLWTYKPVNECEVRKHRTWRRYWSARRALYQCQEQL